ncbi:hypothetical protein VTN96DRAFT_8451 [Rasamsonia emersonii]
MFALRYYVRMRFIMNLLPLLSQCQSRVVSVLDAGKESRLIESDLELRHHHSTNNVIGHSNTMTVLAMEHLAKQYPSISFLHVFPGLVITNLAASDMSWPWSSLVRYLRPLFAFLAVPLEESGQRHLFCATSERYPPRFAVTRGEEGSSVAGEVARGSNGEKGSGVYSLNWDGELVRAKDFLAQYRARGMGETVWAHTLDVFERVLSKTTRA